jgi:hypothetical protein
VAAIEGDRGKTEYGEMEDEEESEESGDGGGFRAGDGLGDGGILAEGDFEGTDGDDLVDLGVDPSGDGGSGVRGDPGSRTRRDN